MTSTGAACVLNSSGEEFRRSFFTDAVSQMTSNTHGGNMSADLKDSVAFAIGYSVPEVQAVFALLDNHVLHVWTVVPEHNRDVYRRIYAKEKEIIGQFGMIDFDFNVIPTYGRNPREIICDPDVQLAFARK